MSFPRFTIYPLDAFPHPTLSFSTVDVRSGTQINNDYIADRTDGTDDAVITTEVFPSVDRPEDTPWSNAPTLRILQDHNPGPYFDVYYEPEPEAERIPHFYADEDRTDDKEEWTLIHPRKRQRANRWSPYEAKYGVAVGERRAMSMRDIGLNRALANLYARPDIYGRHPPNAPPGITFSTSEVTRRVRAQRLAQEYTQPQQEGEPEQEPEPKDEDYEDHADDDDFADYNYAADDDDEAEAEGDQGAEDTGDDDQAE
jgi:hypothetical protein